MSTFYSQENRPRGWEALAAVLLQGEEDPGPQCPLNTSPSPVLRLPGPPPSAAQGSQMEGATSINHLVLILRHPQRWLGPATGPVDTWAEAGQLGVVRAEQVSKAGVGGAGGAGSPPGRGLGGEEALGAVSSRLSWGSRHRGRQTER